MARRRKHQEFKPDSTGTNVLKKLYVTQAQKKTLLKWTAIAALCVLLLVIQDVVMSRISIFGATTDLAACVILLIMVSEGAEVGSLFGLTASLLYLFSGSSPGPYCVALLTILGILAALFRQVYWHRSFSSTVLCTAIALILYEIGIYAVGVFLGLTYWSRFGVFVLTGALSSIVLLPLCPLVDYFGKIGGTQWKE